MTRSFFLICAPSGLSPLENLFLTKLSRNNIETTFSILEIYLQCYFIYASYDLSVFKYSSTF